MLAGYVISVVTQLYFCHTLPDTFVKTCLSSGASLDDPLPPWPSVCFKNSLLFVGCLVSQQHARVSQGQIYTDNFTCCHSEIQVADDRVGSTQTILCAATPRYKLQMTGSDLHNFMCCHSKIQVADDRVRSTQFYVLPLQDTSCRWQGQIYTILCAATPRYKLQMTGSDLHRQFYVLPLRDTSCRWNFLPHPVTVYWHRANRSQCWPYITRCQAG